MPSESPPSVSVVITNFNGEHYLPGMLAALEATGYPFLEIIVCDDASTDAGRLFLRHEHPEVKLLTCNRNLGPSAPRNQGIRAARGDLIMLLDNDAYPYPDAVEPWVRVFVEHPEIVAAMPRVIFDVDPPIIHCDGAATHATGQMWLLNGHTPLDQAETIIRPTQSLMGTAMMFRRQAALAIGGFEKDYFIFFEDHDFGTRMRILQGPILSVPQARIRHLGGTKDLSFRTGADYPLRRRYLIPRNRYMFMLRNLQGRTLLVLSPIFFVYDLSQMVFVVLRGWVEPYFAGLAWDLTHLSRILRKRERIQASRIVPDADILVDGPLPLHPGLFRRGTPQALFRRILDRIVMGLFACLRKLIPGRLP